MKKLLTIKMVGYEFEDLNAAAREQAIFDTALFWVTISDDSEADYARIQDAIEEADRLQTPHFLQNIVADKYKAEIIEELKANDYLFNEEGTMINLCNHLNAKGDITKIIYNNKHEATIENLNPQTKGDVL